MDWVWLHYHRQEKVAWFWCVQSFRWNKRNLKSSTADYFKGNPATAADFSWATFRSVEIFTTFIWLLKLIHFSSSVVLKQSAVIRRKPVNTCRYPIPLARHNWNFNLFLHICDIFRSFRRYHYTPQLERRLFKFVTSAVARSHTEDWIAKTIGNRLQRCTQPKYNVNVLSVAVYWENSPKGGLGTVSKTLHLISLEVDYLTLTEWLPLEVRLEKKS